MARLKRTSRPGYKARYTAYKNEDRAEKNRLRKLRKYVKNNPNCKMAAAALERVKPYKSKPRSKMYPKSSTISRKILKDGKLTKKEETVTVRYSKDDCQLQAELDRSTNEWLYENKKFVYIEPKKK